MKLRCPKLLLRDKKGSVAIEFSILATVFVLLIFGILQFSLYFMSRMAMHDALSDLATGDGRALLAAANRNGTRDFVCGRLVLTPDCETRISLEMRDLKTASPTALSSRFAKGTSGSLMIIRAEAPVMVFVPFVEDLKVRGKAVFLQS